MNVVSRSWLKSVIAILEGQRNELKRIQSDEQENYNRLAESLQYSARSEAISDNIDDLENCICDLGDIIENLQEIVDR